MFPHGMERIRSRAHCFANISYCIAKGYSIISSAQATNAKGNSYAELGRAAGVDFMQRRLKLNLSDPHESVST
jgi:hypothetical protein